MLVLSYLKQHTQVKVLSVEPGKYKWSISMHNPLIASLKEVF